MSSYDIYIRGLIVLVLLFLSSIFSGSETAFTSLTVAKIRQVKEQDEKGAKTLRRIKKRLNSILATILIGNNIVNIAATAILTELTVNIFQGESATLIATMIMTVLVLIFGEVTPKTFAAQNPEKVAIKVAAPLEFLSRVFRPVLFILNAITTFLIKIVGGKIINNAPFITEEEIRTLVDVGEEEGILELREKEMIDGIFDIDDIDVTEVMVPRIDIIAISEDAPFHDALDLAIQFGHSRIPVYKESIDNISGILYAKDMLPFASRDKPEIDKQKITALMRPAYYVPETKRVNNLLKELQQKKTHIAIVLDEYGGTEGLVTIEDILEEIVGDILDEYDNEIDLIEHVGEDTYLVKAEVSLEEINELFKIDLPEEDFDSLGGFIFSTLGRVPILGDTVEIDGLGMTVKKLHNRRIKLVEIKKRNLK